MRRKNNFLIIFGAFKGDCPRFTDFAPRSRRIGTVPVLIASLVLFTITADISEAKKPLVWDTGRGAVQTEHQGAAIRKGSIGGMALISLVAGVLSFLSPCTLPILPAYFAFTFQSDKKRIVLMTLAFFLGLAASFSLMGGVAAFAGSLLKGHMSLFVRLGGMVIFVLGLLSLTGNGFSGVQFQERPAATFIGSFIYGASFSIGWSACVGPILAAILIMASTQETALSGMFLMFIYALGLGFPLILLSFFFNGLNREGFFWKEIKGKELGFSIAGREFHVHSNNLISGLLFIVLGGLMIGDNLSLLNRIIPIEAQMWYARIEEKMMGLLR